MSSEEDVGQRRDLFHDDFAECSVCGQVVRRSELINLDARSPLAEHSEDVLVCRDCRDAISRGEIDLEDLQHPPEADRHEGL